MTDQNQTPNNSQHENIPEFWEETNYDDWFVTQPNARRKISVRIIGVSQGKPSPFREDQVEYDIRDLDDDKA